MALIGGFIASDDQVVDYLRHNMRSQIFAKSLPLPLVLGAQKRLELLKTQPALKDKLWENVAKLQDCVTIRVSGWCRLLLNLMQNLRTSYSSCSS